MLASTPAAQLPHRHWFHSSTKDDENRRRICSIHHSSVEVSAVFVYSNATHDQRFGRRSR